AGRGSAGGAVPRCGVRGGPSRQRIALGAVRGRRDRTLAAGRAPRTRARGRTDRTHRPPRPVRAARFPQDRGRRRHLPFPRLRHGDPRRRSGRVRRLRPRHRRRIPRPRARLAVPDQPAPLPQVAAGQATHLPQRLLPRAPGRARPRQPATGDHRQALSSRLRSGGGVGARRCPASSSASRKAGVAGVARRHDRAMIGPRAKLLLNLRHVPDDEADDVRALLEAVRIDYYETRAGPFGISAGGIWVRDDDDVPDAEADEVPALPEAVRIDYYEPRPGPFGISAGGIWVRDDDDVPEAKRRMADYQRERAVRVRAEHAQARREGTAETFSDLLRAQPLRVLVIVVAIALLLGLMALPAYLIGR